MYLVGYDIGSSSIKAALVAIDTKEVIDVVQHPEVEMEIAAVEMGWAEQDPETWWEHLCTATKKLLAGNNQVRPEEIKGIGIAYQMHGLVVVDKNKNVLRPSIIWCDSRAVEIGDKAFQTLGEDQCLQTLLNSPGNFTASKLKWVKEHEPELYTQIDKFMLPGDFIAMKMTDQILTTMSGLSEGIMWDFTSNKPASFLFDHFGLSEDMIPELIPTCGHQGELTEVAATALGLKPGTPVTYRAGDQPNNAMCLNVLEPGEIAATGGTSGVVYGITDEPAYDPASRVNAFVHVNHEVEKARIGILLCINGAGIAYSWIKKHMADQDVTYEDLEKMAQSIPVGADDLRIIPFGNGAERILSNKNVGAQFINLNFNRHKQAHMVRASLEGIAFSFIYGIDILKEMGLNIQLIRVGNDNLFQSTIFSQTIASLLDCSIEVVDATGAVGAAKAAGIATGHYRDLREANSGLKVVNSFQPNTDRRIYQDAYQVWKHDLEKILK
ncbi:FGGY family carbohydrate kinase [Fulvivirgaceae bacterium BMA12]|uniref:FGGY family carbohydrate kinase n=1 Tax=Agaribacillus aureus TaxID=3051825 RepID=A0ABT8L4L7_9BACT|nr:FGGY family carbohydrate kinase [Fulvivirgaceae bacterium BMA12]